MCPKAADRIAASSDSAYRSTPHPEPSRWNIAALSNRVNETRQGKRNGGGIYRFVEAYIGCAVYSGVSSSREYAVPLTGMSATGPLPGARESFLTPSQQRYKGYSWPLNSNDIEGVVCISVFRKTNRKIVVPAISRNSSILLEK